jgi:hypothetical protein
VLARQGGVSRIAPPRGIAGDAWSPQQILIEDASAGVSLTQTINSATRFPVKPIKVDRDKLARAEAVTGLFESGKVLFPEGAAWLDGFIDELASFPSAVHDDCVDSVTQALNYLRGKPDSSGFIEWAMRQAAKAGGGIFDESDEEYKRVKAELEEERRREQAEHAAKLHPRAGLYFDRKRDQFWVETDGSITVWDSKSQQFGTGKIYVHKKTGRKMLWLNDTWVDFDSRGAVKLDRMGLAMEAK